MNEPGIPAGVSSAAGLVVDGHYFAPAELPTGAAALLRFDGKAWSVISLPDTNASGTPSAVWAASAQDVLAVKGAAVWHWTAGDAELEHEVDGAQLQAVWGTGGDDVWVGGYGLEPNCFDCNAPATVEIHHYDGHGWQRQVSDIEGTIHSIWGSAPDDVWAAGAVLLHFDGSEWQHVMDLDEGSVGQLLWGADRDQVWLTSESGPARFFDGESWSTIDSGGVHVREVHGASGGPVFAYADSPEPQLLQWDGETFVASDIALPAALGRSGVRLGNDERLLLLDGRVFALEDTTFQLWVAPPSQQRVDAAAREALEPDRLIAARGRSLVALDEGRFEPVADLAALGPPLAVYDLAANSDDDVWIGGLRDGSGVFHWDGAALTKVELPNDTRLSFPKVALDDDGELWVAGFELPAMEVEDPVGPVRVFHLDGGAWEEASPDLDAGRPIQLSVAGGQVWIAVADGRVAVREGGTWKRADIKEAAGEVQLAAAAADDVYAIAPDRGEDDSQLLHYDGTDWRAVGEIADRALRYVDAAGPNDVWATGYSRDSAQPIVVHFDGTRWESIDASRIEDIAIPTASANGHVLLSSDLEPWLYQCGTAPSSRTRPRCPLCQASQRN